MTNFNNQKFDAEVEKRLDEIFPSKIKVNKNVKKMREINTNISPNINLIRTPPHNANRNIFSDFVIENLIRLIPIRKLIAEMAKPIIIEIKSF